MLDDNRDVLDVDTSPDPDLGDTRLGTLGEDRTPGADVGLGVNRFARLRKPGQSGWSRQVARACHAGFVNASMSNGSSPTNGSAYSRSRFRIMPTNVTRCLWPALPYVGVVTRVNAPEAAIATMRAAGLEPLEPYVRAINPWRCRCLVCGSEVSPSYNAVQQGKGCRVCANQSRGERARLDPVHAGDVMRAAHAEPLVSYPGGNSRPWLCRCAICGREISPSYANVAKGKGPCQFCGVVRNVNVRRMPAAEAVQRLRAAGAEPSVPFPGRIDRPWPATCSRCGHKITSRL
jgi:hypothetical protein